RRAWRARLAARASVERHAAWPGDSRERRRTERARNRRWRHCCEIRLTHAARGPFRRPAHALLWGSAMPTLPSSPRDHTAQPSSATRAAWILRAALRLAPCVLAAAVSACIGGVAPPVRTTVSFGGAGGNVVARNDSGGAPVTTVTSSVAEVRAGFHPLQLA